MNHILLEPNITTDFLFQINKISLPPDSDNQALSILEWKKVNQSDQQIYPDCSMSGERSEWWWWMVPGHQEWPAVEELLMWGGWGHWRGRRRRRTTVGTRWSWSESWVSQSPAMRVLQQLQPQVTHLHTSPTQPTNIAAISTQLFACYQALNGFAWKNIYKLLVRLI